MKLSEALAERKRLQELIPGISKALQTSITVEEDYILHLLAANGVKGL